MKSFLVVLFALVALISSAQNLTFTQYNVTNVGNLTLTRANEYVNDIGAFRIHDEVDNILNVSKTDVENWIVSNFTNVNTNAFTILAGTNRILTTAETSAIIDGNTETIKIEFTIVEMGGAFHFNLKGKAGSLSNLSSASMTDIENAVNVIYASFVNTVQ